MSSKVDLACVHGRLARSCPLCELSTAEVEIATLRSHVALLVEEARASRKYEEACAMPNDTETQSRRRYEAILAAKESLRKTMARTDAAKIEGVGG